MSLATSTPLEAVISASKSARRLASLPTKARNDGLTAIHSALSDAKQIILDANARDLSKATQLPRDGAPSQSMLKRLDLSTPGKWDDMLKGILDVRDLEDPGVLLVIFEARPEVIANITALAIKSGNVAILKGGKESTESFVAIARVISQALKSTKIPNASIQLVTSRDVIPELLALDQHIDLVIPRGSNELVQYIKTHTRIPVLGHADGLCTIYLHEDADPDQAQEIVVDAKVSYPAACNSVEILLVDEAILSTVFVRAAAALISKNVQLRCDPASLAACTAKFPEAMLSHVQEAQPVDYETEFLDLILAVKTIPSPPSSPVSDETSSSAAAVLTPCDIAIDFINAHSSHHTDAIVTTDRTVAEQFLRGVDSAGVYWNTSTRMADGLRYGFGTEVGISTNKIHARGPVGLEGLMIYKYLIRGHGQVASQKVHLIPSPPLTMRIFHRATATGTLLLLLGALGPRSASSLGINCRGSTACPLIVEQCAQELADYIEEIDIRRWYENGELIACCQAEPLCAFLQKVAAGGASGSAIRAVAPFIPAHGCDHCGSVPLLWPYDNDVERGELTFNTVVREDFCKDGGLC
ncbi:MAG: hypothetical protein M1826_001743 [Phylliscum demangeonii]|nr:MAG: hypothetical protein M1826_001743 [Phylliscum demangeonii]